MAKDATMTALTEALETMINKKREQYKEDRQWRKDGQEMMEYRETKRKEEELNEKDRER